MQEKQKEEIEKGEDTSGSLNTERMNKYAQLIKALLLMGDPQTIEALMSDRFYMNSFGALEILPEFKNRLDCRDFFKNAIFREVIPIKNERLLSKIHMYYRINFLKESIFPN